MKSNGGGTVELAEEKAAMFCSAFPFLTAAFLSFGNERQEGDGMSILFELDRMERLITDLEASLHHELRVSSFTAERERRREALLVPWKDGKNVISGNRGPCWRATAGIGLWSGFQRSLTIVMWSF